MMPSGPGAGSEKRCVLGAAEICRVNYLWYGHACVSGVLRNYRVNNLVVYVENRQHQPDRTRRYGV